MKEKTLKVSNLMFRTDAFPRGLESDYFEMVNVSGDDEVFVHDYDLGRRLTVDGMEKMLRREFAGGLGSELKSLYEEGVQVVLHVDFNSGPLGCYFVSITSDTMRRLSGQARSVGLAFPSCDRSCRSLAIDLPKSLVSLLADFHVDLELGGNDY